MKKYQRFSRKNKKNKKSKTQKGGELTIAEALKILGLIPNYTEKGLRTAYLKKSLKWHPDKHAGAKKAEAEEEFKKN